MVTLAIAAILGGIAAWQISAALPGYRVGHAARTFLADVRLAASIAARTNEPVHLVVDPDSDCGPSWRLLAGASPDAPRLVIDRFCADGEAKGIAFANAGVATGVKCASDLGAALPNCSLCEKDARLTFYPTGETVAVRGGVEIDGHSIVLTPARDPSVRDTMAVGVRGGTGESRLYRPNAKAATGWDCP